MLSLITLNNEEGTPVVLHEDTAASRRLVKEATGLWGTAPLRTSRRVAPQRHGSIDETVYSEGSLVTLDGEVWSTLSTGQIEAAREELLKVTGVCQETLDYDPALLKWTEGVSGLKLQKLVKLASEIDPVIHEAAGFIDYHVQFFAQDPRSYSQTLTQQTGGTITGTEPEEEYVKATANVTLYAPVALDATYIYYASKEDCIGRVKLNGSGNEPEWIKGLANTPRGLAVNASNIFWTGNGAYVSRAAISGTGVEESWAKVGTNEHNAIAINAEHIYLGGSHAYQEIARCTLAGGTPEPEWISNTYGAPVSIAVNASNIFWGHGSAIARATLAGATIEPEWITTSAAVGGGGLVVNASFVYWTNAVGSSIGRAKLNGTEATQALITGAADPRGLAANSEYLYWFNGSTGYIARGPIGGTPVGSALTVAQAGNRLTPVSFRIHGPCKNPSIVRVSDGSRITLTNKCVLASGNFLEVNPAERTVLLNGLSSAYEYISAATTNWPAFEAPPSPRTTEYELTAESATAAYMEAFYRSAYA